MAAVSRLLDTLGATVAELGPSLIGLLRGTGLQLAEAQRARVFLLALAGTIGVVLLLRLILHRHRRIAVPALLPSLTRSRTAFLRHGATALAALGIPLFVIALAEPRAALNQRETSHPGRRIAILLDASSSMLQSMPANRLSKGAPNDAAFFTTVGAARYFVDLRMKGNYRDLMALIEFGDEAYVVTPFTSDYENILISMSLIGDWTEFMNFPEQGTVIARAIEQGVGLFQAFDFLDAAGNAMVIFSDGMDAEVLQDGRTTFDVLREARQAEIPVYFLRVGRLDMGQGVVPDAVWEAAVARTGGRFYSAADESTILRAIHEIDRRSTGRIEVRQYSTQIPRFAAFALAAAALWTAALALRLATPWFTTFP